MFLKLSVLQMVQFSLIKIESISLDFLMVSFLQEKLMVAFADSVRDPRLMGSEHIVN